MNTQIGLGYAGSALIGAGLNRVSEDLKLGMTLLGVGVVLTIAKALFDHFGIPIAGRK